MSADARYAKAEPRGDLPLHPFLVSVPIAFFVATLLSDIAYWMTAEIMWERFSVWLLTFGLIAAVLAAIAGLIDLTRLAAVRRAGKTWLHAAGNIVVIALAALNMLVHTRDAYTAIVPWGLTLSGLIVFVLFFTGWIGASVAARSRIEVAE